MSREGGHKMKRKKGARDLDIKVFYPDSEEDRAEIRRRLARIHAQYVLNYIQNLNCPQWQKEKILDGVIAKVEAAVPPEKEKVVG